MKPMEEMVVTNVVTDYPKTATSSLERKVRPQKEQALNCPRCNSTNTKFCYYNNYSLSQPRYFCKACRRYWTEGGSLRNIPVGGGSRKNKRSNNSSSSTVASNYNSGSSSVTSSSKKQLPGDHLVLPPPPVGQQNPNCKILENPQQDLNLGFSTSNPDHGFKSFTEMIQVPSFGNKEMLQNPSPPSGSNLSALELLTGFTGSRGLNINSFMPLSINSNANNNNNNNNGGASTADHHQHHHHPSTVYSTGFPLAGHDQFIRPSLNFSLDGIGSSSYGSFQAVQETANGKILFPFEDLKQVSSSVANHDGDQQEANRDQQGDNSSAGFWINGVMGGGGGSW